jgi:hypothetical protein
MQSLKEALLGFALGQGCKHRRHVAKERGAKRRVWASSSMHVFARLRLISGTGLNEAVI